MAPWCPWPLRDVAVLDTSLNCPLINTRYQLKRRVILILQDLLRLGPLPMTTTATTTTKSLASSENRAQADT